MTPESPATVVNPKFRRFVLVRTVDESGVSGTGTVAEGVKFGNGKCVLCWRGSLSSVAVYESIELVTKIHGHDGKSVVVWVDNLDSKS